MSSIQTKQEPEAPWAAIRQVVLARDGYQCCRCGCDDRRELDVHHQIPRHLGGRDEPANLLTLCGGCHGARHQTLHALLGRNIFARWAIRLARLVDFGKLLPSEETLAGLLPVLRLLSKTGEFREGQLEVVLAALKGESLLVVRPTGAGKSLCFQLPALLTSGTAYVISPLKALMADQVAGLQNKQIPATFINSDLNPQEKQLRLQLLRQGCWKLVYCAPERFNPNIVRNPADIAALTAIRPSFLVVDEAHCIDRWGEDFRPDYSQLGEIRRQLGSPPVLAFTATAGRETQQRILSSLGVAEGQVFASDIDRPNIAFIRQQVKDTAQRCQIICRLLSRVGGKVLIFVPTRRIGDEVQQALVKLRLQIPFYHAKLPAVERDFLLAQFTGRNQPEVDAIICTNAFGMGLDIPNIRLVIHWLQPASVEDYVQEMGRAGRDGRQSYAVLFWHDRDIGLLDFMAEKTMENMPGDAERKRRLLTRKKQQIRALRAMIAGSAGHAPGCFRAAIRRYFYGDTGLPRKPLAIRILEWVFARRQQKIEHGDCCDHRRCQNGRIRRLLAP